MLALLAMAILLLRAPDFDPDSPTSGVGINFDWGKREVAVARH
jgi:hypothetical protein